MSAVQPAGLHSVEEAPLPYREPRLVRALERLSTFANGRVLAVRGIDYLGLQLVTLARGPIEPARRDRVARELRLLLAE